MFHELLWLDRKDGRSGQPPSGCRFTLLSVHGHVVNRAIPLAGGITFFTMVMLSVYKDTFKVNSILRMYPGTAVSACNILDVFSFHHSPQNEYGILSHP